jgi:hypothetical protein
MGNDSALRRQLLDLLRGGHAHMSFDDAVEAFPPGQLDDFPAGVGYTPWHLLEHVRIAQWDILMFIRDPHHISPAWPEGYWPPTEAKAGEADWQATLAGFRADHHALEEIVADPRTDLTGDLPHAPGYSILREILVVSDHNAYHIGEFAILRQVMHTWPNDRAG